MVIIIIIINSEAKLLVIKFNKYALLLIKIKKAITRRVIFF